MATYQVIKLKYDENGAYLEVTETDDQGIAMDILTEKPNLWPAVMIGAGHILRSRSVKRFNGVIKFGAVALTEHLD